MIMSFVKKIAPYITISNAREWESDSEKWMYVTEIITSADIEYDPHDDEVERMVNHIESQFEKLLENNP